MGKVIIANWNHMAWQIPFLCCLGLPWPSLSLEQKVRVRDWPRILKSGPGRFSNELS